MACSKRVNISLSKEQLALVRKFNGTMGNSDSEIIRNILLAWFSEKGVISKNINLNEDSDDENSSCFFSR